MMSVRLQSVLIIVLFSETMAKLSLNFPPQGGATVSFPENQAVGTALYTIQADDPSGNQPIFAVLNSTCESTTPSPTRVTSFPITNTDQLVVPAGGLDAETCSKYTFTFSVTAGTSSLESGPLTILVTDINDNPPKFSKTSYSGEVWKNDGQGQIVSDDNINATDPDVSKLLVTLSISGAQTAFAINTNGFVYVSDSSGLAALSSPTVLTIQAYDGGLSSNAALNIAVHDNPCSNTNPLCQNGGTCHSTRGNYTCACLSGYDGNNCQNVNYCYISPCKNNGTCNNLYMYSDYNCSCVWPYNSTIPENKNCTILNHCHINPCQNNGTCFNLDSDYNCSCVWPFDSTSPENKNCTILNHCHINPCQNNGTCFNLDSDYNCSCVWPFDSTTPENKNCTIRVSTSTESTTTTNPGVSTSTESTTTTNPDVSTYTTSPVGNTTCYQNCKTCKKNVCCPKIVIYLPPVCVAAIIISTGVFALKKRNNREEDACTCNEQDVKHSNTNNRQRKRNDEIKTTPM